MKWILILACALAAETLRAEKLEKLVVAHYMTDMLPQTERPLNRWIDPELSDPNGSTAAVNGLQQTVPMASLYLDKVTLEQAVAFEIRAAQQLGVDGFQFYYPLVENPKMLSIRYNEIIREFLRQSETKFPGFRISVCLCNPSPAVEGSEAERIEIWGKPLRELMGGTTDSKAWLRNENGNILFFLWVADSLAGSVPHRAETPQQIRDVGAAFQKLASVAGAQIDYVYQIRRFNDDAPYLEAIMETFPAVWGWTDSEENEDFWDRVARRCHETGTLYTQSVYPDYYTSKTYSRDAAHRFLTVDEAMKLGPEGNERHYRVTNLTDVQIRLLKKAKERDAGLINYVTWNDYPEGHHLAPEVVHGFGPALLLRYFKEDWQSGEVAVDRDEAAVFYKLYRHDVSPEVAFPLFIKSGEKVQTGEDRIELVTFLTKPAECFLNGQSLGSVEAGLQVNAIPSEVGPVTVEVKRDGESILKFEAPVSITDAPIRTDRLTYSHSSAFEREMEQLFPQRAASGKKQ